MRVDQCQKCSKIWSEVNDIIGKHLFLAKNDVMGGSKFAHKFVFIVGITITYGDIIFSHF